MNVGALITKVRKYVPTADVELIERAYKFSARCHRGQKRHSGEPYVTHPLAVASIIADMRLDLPTIVTGLLHDTVEDTLATIPEITEEFGEEVADLVDGVTKISQLEADSRVEAEARTMRKMFLASAKDIRVLLVKLADRAHNLRTIGHLKLEKQQRICQETLDIYAPIAHRLGIYWLKSEFEDITFSVLEPEIAADIVEKLELNRVQREGYMDEVSAIIVKRLAEAGIEAEVAGRQKSAYSVHQKTQAQGLHYDDVYDVVAFRVLVDAERDCYDALGIVHNQWRPVPGRFRDYVALPKENLYQSLHTTVIGPYGERMEVQIRTHEMHQVAEFGIAAHWKYKEVVTASAAAEDGKDAEDREAFSWVEQLLDWHHHDEDPVSFLRAVKENLFAEEIIVFTPRGDSRTLPKGATIVDFAYMIHSEVGDHCAAGRVNGQLVAPRQVLESGDTAEVITTDDQTPDRNWLKFVKTPRARGRILSWIKHHEKERAGNLGREILERDLVRHDLSLESLTAEGGFEELLEKFGYDDEERFFQAIGYGRVRPKQVVEFLAPDARETEPGGRSPLRRLFGLLERGPRKGRSLVELGSDDEQMVRFGGCCSPLPGEEVVGFLTRGRGVTVHANECERLIGADPDRLIDVVWKRGARAPRTVRLEITSRDRPGILAQMTQAISTVGVNISKAYVRTTTDRTAVNVFELTLHSSEDLERIERNLKKIQGLKEIRRLRA